MDIIGACKLKAAMRATKELGLRFDLILDAQFPGEGDFIKFATSFLISAAVKEARRESTPWYIL